MLKKTRFFVHVTPDMHKKMTNFKHNRHQFESNLEKVAVLFIFFTFLTKFVNIDYHNFSKNFSKGEIKHACKNYLPPKSALR